MEPGKLTHWKDLILTRLMFSVITARIFILSRAMYLYSHYLISQRRQHDIMNRYATHFYQTLLVFALAGTFRLREPLTQD